MRIVGQHLVLYYPKWLKVICFLLFGLGLNAQNIVKMWVMDENEIPLVGVNIISTNDNNGAVTDINGLAKVPFHDNTDTFQISYVGYKTLEVYLSEYNIASDKIIVNLVPNMVITTIELIGRTGLDQTTIPYEVQNISSAKIDQLASQTSADIIAQSGDVFVQKSQMGGGSPIMRGFEANKLLLVIDGVRMNNAIYRSGHLQNAITVDASGLSRIELIYGPNSLLYGSDALGGVVHFKTKDPILSYNGSKHHYLHAFARYSSANKGQSYHVDGSFGHDKWGGLLSMSYNQYGDLRTGDKRKEKYPDFGKRLFYIDQLNGSDTILHNQDPNVQLGTKFNQWDIYGKLKFKPNSNTIIKSNIQYSNSSDIPRYDQLNTLANGQLKFADWHYGPQERLLVSTSYQLKPSSAFIDELNIIAAYQKIQEDRVSRKYQSITELNNNELVHVASLTMDLKSSKSEDKYFLYGIEFNHNDVLSTAFSRDIETNARMNNISTRYPDGGSNMTQWAAYGIWHYGWNSKSNLELGVRANLVDLNILYLDRTIVSWPEDFYEGIHRRNSALTWSAGWNYETDQKWHWRALIATAFRAPNIDDFAKIRIKNSRVSIPNIALKQEQSYNAEIGIEKTFNLGNNLGKIQCNVTSYFTRLFDLIVNDSFNLADGSPTWEIDGEIFQVTSNQNISNAYIYGVSAMMKWDINHRWSSDVRFNWLKGRTWDNDLTQFPLAHIPPAYGSSSITYSRTKWSFAIQTRWNGHKPLSEYAIGSSDNAEYATPEGSLSWMIFNVFGSYKINQHFDVQLRANNLFDIHYRTFASGVSAPGRNIIGTFHYRL